jgi:hypothetical protein
LLAGGFGVYLQAYRARLTAALRDNFPVLQRALGDDAFDALARAYIDEHPSHFRSIRWFGDSLAEFLAAAPGRSAAPCAGRPGAHGLGHAYRVRRCGCRPPDFGELAALPPEDWPQRRFKPVPSLQLLDLAWGVEPIWKALNADAQPPARNRCRLPHVLLIWRPELDCCWRSADSLRSGCPAGLDARSQFCRSPVSMSSASRLLQEKHFAAASRQGSQQ